MEIHRLKPMPENYDSDLFNTLYEQTQGLRKALAYQIDARRFGVTPDIVLSWFDDKFIFVYSKYFGKMDKDTLKGFIINSLKTFKFRILRKAYQEVSLDFYNNIIDLDSSEVYTIKEETPNNTQEILLGIALSFFKKHLTDEAYALLELQLNPPFYILSRMRDPNTRIPTPLILEFLGVPHTKDNASKVNKLRRQVEATIIYAKSYFSKVDLSLAIQ